MKLLIYIFWAFSWNALAAPVLNIHGRVLNADGSIDNASSAVNYASARLYHSCQPTELAVQLQKPGAGQAVKNKLFPAQGRPAYFLADVGSQWSTPAAAMRPSQPW
jgi:hypothetical protein